MQGVAEGRSQPPTRPADNRPIEEALAAAEAVLASDPGQALAVARQVLRTRPDHPPALLLAGRALRRMGNARDALGVLAGLARRQPRSPDVLWEMAQAASEAGDPRRAILVLEDLTRVQPNVAQGWFLLASLLRAQGRDADAWRADLSGVHAASRDPALLRAAVAMNEGRFDEGEAMLDARLRSLPGDAVGSRLLGEIRWRRGDMTGALAMVEQAVRLAPGFDRAREFLVRLLLQSNRLAEALDHAQVLAASPLGHRGHDLLRASVLVAMGDQAGAATIYKTLLAEAPEQPQVWQNLGHVLKTLGRQADALLAYREAVTRQPTLGEAWWSLANLKTVKLDAADIAAMEAALGSLPSDDAERQEDIYHLHFALGKALEDVADYARSFTHYDRGNRLRRLTLRYNADAFAAETTATASAFTHDLVARCRDGGCPAYDPIFIVGLPRSGSTLVEQILASHSRIEGTMELPDMMMIAGRLTARIDSGEFADWRALIASLSDSDRLRLGDEYLERARVHRKTDRPLFTDKMPNNWQHIGLIKAILPNARIIDVRRHPMACCFSGWKQHFARGQAFSYDLTDIGRYYAGYVDLMAAYDRVAPGAVHRIIYERLVADTEAEVRRLLAYLALPFEPACLEFYRNDRAVRTPSSEQVRQPIFTDGLEQWRHYRPWLAPLAAALGTLSETYAGPVPEAAAKTRDARGGGETFAAARAGADLGG